MEQPRVAYYDGTQPRIWDQPPEQGSLPARQAQHLATVLEQFTTTADDCYYAVWDGFSALAVPTDGVATMQLPLTRTMVLYEDHWPTPQRFDDIAPIEQSPNLWWPADRTWCIATDIDLDSSYIGGSETCIDTIFGEPSLEQPSPGRTSAPRTTPTGSPSAARSPRPTRGPQP
ncbi:hypothetical protein HH310_05680 [Actinoplanes sp. TBRC 11911]|uniref:hypothetical protein n=1 Tax=Actinoplanes sp. TBRC 11911 TaxID=2729386 RepID=UPI00145CF108|nr:hypothetical protein [Actinoplanes sp. TBRC 11911]NMO50685.1 hypothetical protein [Actinoplanes sp. TBRC 11911]